MKVDLRQRILEVAMEIIAERGSENLRVSDVAERARTGIPTIYYYFESRSQLLAEAQVLIYLRMVEPLHASQVAAESALDEEDEESFFAAIENNLIMAWSAGQVEEKLGIMKLFQDVWSHERSRVFFTEMLESQFERWSALLERAEGLGWVDPEIDVKTLLAFFWAASVGQVITANAAAMDLAPERVRDLVLKIIQKRSRASRPAL